MTISVGYLGNELVGATAPERRRIVAAADASGIDHLAMGDHVSFFVGMGMDALIHAAALLALSDRLRVTTAVYLLPLRHPVLVARQLSDLAVLAPGRLTLGVGLGGEDPHELEICGVDPRTRGRRLDACIDIVRGLLRGEPVDHDGEFFQLDQALIVPAPPEPIPIVVGGRSDAAISRAAQRGDGWLGIWVSAKRYAGVVEQISEQASEAGRDDVAWQHGLNVWCGVGANKEEARSRIAPAMEAFYQIPFENFEKWSPYGSADDIAEFLAPYIVAGCGEFNLIMNAESSDQAIETVAAVRRLLL